MTNIISITYVNVLYHTVSCQVCYDVCRSSMNVSFKQRVNNIVAFLTKYNQWYQVMTKMRQSQLNLAQHTTMYKHVELK